MVARQTLDLLVGVRILPGEIATVFIVNRNRDETAILVYKEKSFR